MDDDDGVETNPDGDLKLNLSMMYAEQDGQLDMAHHGEQPLKEAFQKMETCQFGFSSLADIRNINAVLKLYFEDNKKVLAGIKALMINALEHGILNIGYETKAELIATGRWVEEIDARTESPDMDGKKAEIIITNKEDGIYVVVSDPGHGFPWKNYLKIDPIRAGRKHGRGIALANALSFDKLSYNEEGNQAIAFISHQDKIQW